MTTHAVDRQAPLGKVEEQLLQSYLSVRLSRKPSVGANCRRAWRLKPRQPRPQARLRELPAPPASRVHGEGGGAPEALAPLVLRIHSALTAGLEVTCSFQEVGHPARPERFLS